MEPIAEVDDLEPGNWDRFVALEQQVDYLAGRVRGLQGRICELEATLGDSRSLPQEEEAPPHTICEHLQSLCTRLDQLVISFRDSLVESARTALLIAQRYTERRIALPT